ncbi:MAG: hypothetical protein AAB351_02240 [Patescibacteria group bacterium]
MSTKVQIPSSDTGSWEEVDLSNTKTRGEKDDAYIDFFNKYAGRIKKIENDLAAKEKDEIKSSNRNIEILAVFVTLFTFISIETQILRSGISFITAVGFSLLMLGGLLFFIFSLNFFIKNERVRSDFGQYFILLLVALFVLCSGLVLIYKGEEKFQANFDDKYYKKTEIEQQIMLKSNELLDNFKKCVLQKGNYWPCLK